jgi:hypothetical protein
MNNMKEMNEKKTKAQSCLVDRNGRTSTKFA